MSEWDDVADTWDTEEPVRAYASAASDSLVQLASELGVAVGGSALDFGCGTGLLTERLAVTHEHVDAVDPATKMLDVLRVKAADHGWTHVDISAELPDESGPYNLIVASSVLGFVDDHPATVRLLADRLAPGGLLVHWDWEADPSDADDPHGLLRADVEVALTDAGLVDIGVRTAFTIEFESQSMSPLMGWGRRPT